MLNMGPLLRQILKDRGISIRQFSTKVHLSYAGLLSIIRGRSSMSLKRLDSVAKALNVPAHELVRLSEDYEPPEIKDDGEFHELQFLRLPKRQDGKAKIQENS